MIEDNDEKEDVFENLVIQKLDSVYKYYRIKYTKEEETSEIPYTAIIKEVPEDSLDIDTFSEFLKSGSGTGNCPVIYCLSCSEGDSACHGPEPTTSLGWSGPLCSGTTTVYDFSGCNSGGGNDSGEDGPYTTDNGGNEGSIGGGGGGGGPNPPSGPTTSPSDPGNLSSPQYLVDQLGLSLTAAQSDFLIDTPELFDEVEGYLNSNSSDLDKYHAAFLIEMFRDKDWIARLKIAIANGITSTAELTHSIYKEINKIVDDNPSLLPIMNVGIDGLKSAANILTDTNTQTADWLDLFNMWLFELGSNPANFDGNDITTLSLKTQEGVNEARTLALQQAALGNFNPDPHTWSYSQGEFYDGMTNGNIATSFLGSYTTSITVVQNANGTVTLTFTVTNPSTWSSATRLRIDNDGNGSHDGIFPNKDRDKSIHLGGNFDQNWIWSETHP